MHVTEIHVVYNKYAWQIVIHIFVIDKYYFYLFFIMMEHVPLLWRAREVILHIFF